MRLHGHDSSTICERGQCRCEAPKRLQGGGRAGVSVSGAARARWAETPRPRGRAREFAPAAGVAHGGELRGRSGRGLGRAQWTAYPAKKHAQSAAGWCGAGAQPSGAHAWHACGPAASRWPGLCHHDDEQIAEAGVARSEDEHAVAPGVSAQTHGFGSIQGSERGASRRSASHHRPDAVTSAFP